MIQLTGHLIKNLAKSWFTLGYFLFLSLSGWGIFLIESHPSKALLTLMEVTILVVPLISMVFSAMYYYSSLEFISLMLAQPLERKVIIRSLTLSLGGILLASYLAGIGVPLLTFHFSLESLILIMTGSFLTLIFSSMALLISSLNRDKGQGMGFSLLAWAFFTVIFDGILLYLMYYFSDYPIESAVLGLSLLNPVDTARILVIMQTDASALLGYTGAVFRNFFGSSTGSLISFGVMALWYVVPTILTERIFGGKDF